VDEAFRRMTMTGDNVPDGTVVFSTTVQPRAESADLRHARPCATGAGTSVGCTSNTGAAAAPAGAAWRTAMVARAETMPLSEPKRDFKERK